jgi:hypothetical protein
MNYVLPASGLPGLLVAPAGEMQAPADAPVSRMAVVPAVIWSCMLAPPPATNPGVRWNMAHYVIIHSESPPISFFPDGYDAWCWNRLDCFSEMQWSRVAGGYSIAPPPFYWPSTVVLPGMERVHASCRYLHRDGSWEGRIEGFTANDMTRDQLRMVNAQLGLAGTQMELVAGHHGYRRGHLVRFGFHAGLWVPIERAGGMA